MSNYSILRNVWTQLVNFIVIIIWLLLDYDVQLFIIIAVNIA